MLESRGIRCWIAPRDILPGADWVESIVDALEESRIFVVVLSADSNNSPQVIREVGRAASRDIPIIPLRIDNAPPSKSMDFYISSHQWLDAYTPPLEKHLQQLADTVQTLLTQRYGIRPQPVSVEESRPEELAGKISEAVVQREEREAKAAAKVKAVSEEKPPRTGGRLTRLFWFWTGRAEGRKYSWLPKTLTVVVVLGVLVAAGVIFLPGLWSDKESTDGDGGGSETATYQLEVIVDPPGGGSVSPESGSYDDGDSFTLTATPSENYRFDQWSGDVEGTEQDIEITIDSDKNVTAHFTEIIYCQLTVTVDPPGGGSVSHESGSYNKGDSIILTATPSENYGFEYWSGDAEGTGRSTVISMDSDKTVTAHFASEPMYGGKHVVARTTDITYFDEVVGGNYGGHVYAPANTLTKNELLQGDWTKGPAGTGESDFMNGGDNRMDLKTGCLADSWEIPELGTIIFHIRQGVRWQYKEPVNGRLLTASDVRQSLERAVSEGYFAYFYASMCATIEITSDNAARTVTVSVPVSEWVNMITLIPDYTSIVCPEVVEEYGGETEWENVVGTGPFILTDFVSNSQATFTRNPNYWETDPIGPGMGNRLPYLDECQYVIVPDSSVREAAFRSADIDVLVSMPYNDAQPIITDSKMSDIEYKEYLPDGVNAMFFRTDMPESPFSIKEVRQAMMLAIDQPLIRGSYWQGSGEILTWPLTPTKEYQAAMPTLEELPDDVAALYGCDVEAAQALLATTPYPDGFDCSVICWQTPAMIDILSIYQEMLADIGINMSLDIVDQATYNSRARSRNYDAYEIMYATDSGNGTYMKMIDFRGTSSYNVSRINEDYSVPEIEEAYGEMIGYVGLDEAAMMAVNKELMPWLLEQAYCIPSVVPEYYTLWWPWVKNYYGTYAVGYYNYWGSAKYRWLDLDLKEAMGH